MTTQLTEAGLREAVAHLRTKMVERDALTDRAEKGEEWWGHVHNANDEIERAENAVVVAALALNTAAQILLTPEGGGMQATEITLGVGLVDITEIKHEGRVGILFRPRQEHVPFGGPGVLPEGEYWPVAGDVVLWVAGDGPGVAIDALARLSPPTGSAGDDETPDADRLLKDALFACIATGCESRGYSGVQVGGGRYARIKFWKEDLTQPAPAGDDETGVREAIRILTAANRTGDLPGCMMPDGAEPCSAFSGLDQGIRDALAALSLAPAARAGDGVEIPQEVRDRHTDAVVAKRAWQDGTGSWSATCAADIWFSQAALDWITSALTAAPAANGEDA